MSQPQHFVDLQENSGLRDPKQWLSRDHISSPTHRFSQSSLFNSSTANPATATGTNGNVDHVLYNDLVQIVPLVQSLIDHKASSSFTRRGSMVYTKTPSRDSLSKRGTESKGRNTVQSMPAKKKRDHVEKDQEKDKEELIVLMEQVEDLQRKLSEKDELLKSAEISTTQMDFVNERLNAMKVQAAEKDSLIKSTQSKLSDTKIKLADKQAALEKVQWEAMTSKGKVEKLEEELKSMQGDMSSFMLLVDGLTKNGSDDYAEDYDFSFYQPDPYPSNDDMDGIELQKMEEAREAYIEAVAMVKEKQDDESIAAAASARLRLQSFVFRTISSGVE